MRLGADASAAGRRENASYCWSSPFCQSLVTRLIVSISRDGALDRDAPFLSGPGDRYMSVT